MATQNYKFGGSKRQGEVVNRLIVPADKENDLDQRSVAVGGEIELSDKEHEELKGSFKLGKAGDSSSDDEGDGTDEPETREQQQQSQASGSGAQHGTAGQEAGSALGSPGKKNR